MNNARFSLRVEHAFKPGDYLIRPCGVGRASRFVVDETPSPFQVRVIRIHSDGTTFGQAELISGNELKYLMLDELANNLSSQRCGNSATAVRTNRMQ